MFPAVAGDMRAGVERRISATALAVAICAIGRSLDFATTWVAISAGQAAEAKPFPSQLFAALGYPLGLVLYEALITTPLLFLGCHLARRVWMLRSKPSPGGPPGGLAVPVYSLAIGLVSFLAAVHNARYLL